MKENSISFVPIGGLCNRMRAMASGVYIARKLDCPVSVHWNENSECFANFSDLFQPVLVDGVSVKPFSRSDFYLALDRKRNLYIPGVIRNFIFDKQLVDSKWMDDREIEKLQGHIYMISGGFVAKCYSLTELFVPTVEIQEKIDELRSHYSKDVLGIHIRRTDNKWSIQNNEIDDYLRFMDQKVDSCSDVKFYLATDSMDVKRLMINRYGNKIIFHKALLERSSVQGMKDAVIDLWCLSLTKEIIGSYYSS
ncbi:MAG: hypothetical protein NTY32_04770, partial [Bacteroidia bacterium]|nr:hypothetical protein [Bacteroidia bacterium]